MTPLAAVFRQVAFENKTFWRNPASAFFTFAFPLMFLVIFNGVFGGGTITRFGGETSISTFYVPAIAAFSVITACYTNIAIGVSFTRDEGILKRIRGTPLPGWAYLTARIVHSAMIAIILVAIVAVAGVLFYNVDLPGETFLAFVAIVLVGAASFCALGLAVTSLVPNADAAPAVVNASILPLLFISDIFISLEDAPGWLITVARVFPIKHYADAMLAAFHPFDPSFKAVDLAIVALWGAAGLLLAARFFSWEPRR